MYTLFYWLGWLVWLGPDLAWGFIKGTVKAFLMIPQHPEVIMLFVLVGIIVSVVWAMIADTMNDRPAQEIHFKELAKHESYCTAFQTLNNRLEAWRKDDPNRFVRIKDVNRMIADCEKMQESADTQATQNKFLGSKKP